MKEQEQSTACIDLESEARSSMIKDDGLVKAQHGSHYRQDDFIAIARVDGKMSHISINKVLSVLPLTQVGPVNKSIFSQIDLKSIFSIGVVGAICRFHFESKPGVLDLTFDNVDQALDFCLECQSRMQACMIPLMSQPSVKHEQQQQQQQQDCYPELCVLISDFVNSK